MFAVKQTFVRASVATEPVARRSTATAAADSSTGAIEITIPSEISESFARNLSFRSYADPINIPTIKTSTPPTTTWNVAESTGVSM